MATIKDIAKVAGVNVSTVSRALNGSSEVGEDTRKKIEAIAKELGYTPDYSAKAMVGKGTRLVGMIVPEISSNYYAGLVNQVERELNGRGYTLIIAATDFNEHRELQSLETFQSRRVDGILFSSNISPVSEAFFGKQGRKAGAPVVFLEPLEDIRSQDSVFIDGYYGIELAVTHLRSLGHESIGFVGEELSSRYRLPAFRKAMETCGLPCRDRFILSGKERFELGGYLRMKELLGAKELPTAIFAAYDNIAIGAVKALHEAGLRVPHDISIVGYDNIREAEYLLTPLTTVSPPVGEMAAEGVRRLLERIEGRCEKEPRSLILRPELIVRESTSRVPDKCIISAMEKL